MLIDGWVPAERRAQLQQEEREILDLYKAGTLHQIILKQFSYIIIKLSPTVSEFFQFELANDGIHIFAHLFESLKNDGDE